MAFIFYSCPAKQDKKKVQKNISGEATEKKNFSLSNEAT